MNDLEQGSEKKTTGSARHPVQQQCQRSSGQALFVQVSFLLRAGEPAAKGETNSALATCSA